MVEKVLKSEKYYVRKSQILGSASKVSHLIHYDLKCLSFSSFFKISRQFLLEYTAPKTISPRSWNITENSKMLNKYHISINFLGQKKTVFPISEKFKTKAFPYSVNMVFHAKKIQRNLYKADNLSSEHLLKTDSHSMYE